MKDKEFLDEFVARLRQAGGENLVSVVLYGSAAEGEFHAQYSDLNLLVVLGDAGFVSLQKIAPAVKWWHGKKHNPPLLLTREDLRTSRDVFSIEFLDMKQRYRVLHGEDVLRDLVVPMDLHRRQLEYELREKLLLLRQHFVSAGGDEKQLWEIMLRSLSSFTTLFRHALLELGEQDRKHSREAVAELAGRMNFDAVFLTIMDVRAGKAERRQYQAGDIAQRYLAAIEKVTAAVDTMQ
jgi:predicted nucleotidyltransferase